MSHPYTCHYCNNITAELYSFQSLTPSGRVGFDLYECKACGVRYLWKDGMAKPTRSTKVRLAKQMFAEVLDRYEHPEKFLKEQKEHEEDTKIFKDSEFCKAFVKGFEKNK